jgi:selenide,water dikinase
MRLSQYSHGGGCGCKISPSTLKLLLQEQKCNLIKYDNLLVGIESNDDAAVYKISETQAIVNSLDFFPPLVDDPFLYGRIAACNAVSDIYAMGGNPIIAMAILGMPIEKINTDIISEILRGGESVCKELNIPLAGGHSIDLTEPIYGLSVTGIIDLCNLKRNNTACNGDAIILSKPIGIGIISTAIKNEIILNESDEYKDFFEVVTKINSIGSKIAKFKEVSSMTDVTGFSLLGHLHEMALGSNLTACINYHLIPIIKCAEKLAEDGKHTNGSKRNHSTYIKDILFNNLSEWKINLLFDPQTNGGLLLTCSQEIVGEIMTQFSMAGFSPSIIGYMKPYEDVYINVSE